MSANCFLGMEAEGKDKQEKKINSTLLHCSVGRPVFSEVLWACLKFCCLFFAEQISIAV